MICLPPPLPQFLTKLSSSILSFFSFLDYEVYLKKLQDASKGGFDDLFNKANQLRPEIPPLTMREKGKFVLDIDEKSQKLIPTGKLNGEHIALLTKGDGNCLFRAASILAFGDESKHLEMRVRTAVELACNKSHYLTDPNNKKRIHAQERYILRKSSLKRRDECSEELDTSVLEVEFKKVVSETCKESNLALFWHLLALPTVFRRPVKIVFPGATEDIRELQECFNDLIHPREGCSMLDPLVIMWTSIQPSEEMEPNHFVPLVPAGEVHSLGKGKLKIFLIVFTKWVNFFLVQEKSFCLAVIFRTDHYFPSDCFLVTWVNFFF